MRKGTLTGATDLIENAVSTLRVIVVQNAKEDRKTLRDVGKLF